MSYETALCCGIACFGGPFLFSLFGRRGAAGRFLAGFEGGPPGGRRDAKRLPERFGRDLNGRRALLGVYGPR
jgi:hypothetical protein